MVVDRKAALRRVGLVVLGANLGLLVAKAAVYEITGSLAVGSEAVNSLSDTLYSLIVLGGLYLTTQPPDFEHPHGHERIEPFVSLVVAVGVFLAGGVVLFEAVQHLSRGLSPPAAGAPAIAVLVGAVVIKLGLYRYVLGVASEFSSPALEATAVDTRTDVLTAGAALTGVVGAVVGIPILDPAAAGLVAVGIIYTGLAIVRDNVGYLVGAGPPEPLREKISSWRLPIRTCGGHTTSSHTTSARKWTSRSISRSKATARSPRHTGSRPASPARSANSRASTRCSSTSTRAKPASGKRARRRTRGRMVSQAGDPVGDAERRTGHQRGVAMDADHRCPAGRS